MGYGCARDSEETEKRRDEVAKQFGISPAKVTEWKNEFLKLVQRQSAKVLPPLADAAFKHRQTSKQVWSTAISFIPKKTASFTSYAFIDVLYC